MYSQCMPKCIHTCSAEARETDGADKKGDIRLKTHACVGLRYLVCDGRCKCCHTLSYISKMTGTGDVLMHNGICGDEFWLM